MLTTGSWPAATGAQCELPPSLEQGKAVFEQFYRAKHSGRKLTWHSQLGTADLHCTIRGQRHTINVTTHQMCVLMLLNDSPSLTFKDLVTVRPHAVCIRCDVHRNDKGGSRASLMRVPC